MDKNGVKNGNFLRYIHTHWYAFEIELLLCAFICFRIVSNDVVRSKEKNNQNVFFKY